MCLDSALFASPVIYSKKIFLIEDISQRRKKKREEKKRQKCSSTGSFPTLTLQLMSAVRTWENRPCFPSSLALQA